MSKSAKKRCGGKHRYVHQLSKLDTTKENFIDKKVLFQECLKQSTRKQVKGDSCIGVDGLTHSLNNLELLGKSASKVMQRNKTKEYCKNTKDNSTVDSTCANSGVVLGGCSEKSCTEAESGLSSSQSEEQYESCTSDNYESSNSSDSLNAYNIQHWSEEEALDYIRFLKKKIVKIEQVLKVRSESSSLDLQNNNSESLQGLHSNDTSEMSVKYDIKDTKHSKQRSKHNCPQKNTTKVSEVSEDASQTALPSDWNKSLGQLHSSLIDGQSHYARSLAAFKKPRKGKLPDARQKGKRASVLRLFQQMRSFLQADSSRTFTFPALSRHMQLAVHKYAEACGVHSKSNGRKGKRAVTITRKCDWSIPDEDIEESILQNLGLGSNSKQKMKTNNQKSNKSAKVAISAASMYSAQGREELENSLAAATITNDNIGHRILETMGWSKGQSLGHPNRNEAGLKKPLSVHIRPPRAGLGSYEGGI